MVDFNDLLREDIEKWLDGEALDTASLGFIVLVVWGLEMLVAVTLAITYQGRDADMGLLEWAWGVGRLAASPFFIVDGVAFTAIVLYLMGYLGVQTVSWFAESTFGKTVMFLTQLAALVTIAGPGAMRLWQKCSDNGRLNVKQVLEAKIKHWIATLTRVKEVVADASAGRQ